MILLISTLAQKLKQIVEKKYEKYLEPDDLSFAVG